MKKALWISVFFLCIGLNLFSQQNVTWSLSLLKGSDGIPFSRPVLMKDGDSFCIIVQPRQACYAYVVAQDSERQLIVLYNGRLAANETWQTPIILLTPPGGAETFHIVISQTEQSELKNAIETYQRQPGARTAQGLNTAIAGVRRDTSAFKENPERAVGMGGAFRGRDPGGTEYSGAGAYVKTIVINH